MNSQNPLLEAGAFPADMKVLEALISDMHGQKRNYVSQKIKHYQELLKSDNDVVLMQALTELNSDLTMTAEDQWVGQPLGLLIPDILNCLDMEFLPEIMMMASTCLNNILEVSPEACAAIVENNGLERVGLKLFNNDMTEGIINCLEKVSMEYSNVLLASGVLEILMNVMDFLVIQSQVTILKIVSRIFKSFSDNEDDLEMKIIPIIPKIKEVLQNSDKTEEVSIEIYLNLTKRIYKLYESDRDTLESKINRVALKNDTVQFLIGLAVKAVELPDNKNQTTILNLFTIFNKFAFMSSDLSQEMLNLRIDKLVLKCLDVELGGQGQAEVGKMIMNEIVSFINTLLSLNNYQNEFFQKMFGLAGIEILKHHNTDKKVKFIEDHAELIKDLLTKIVRDCTSIFEASDDFFFKYLFLTALRKIVMFLDADTLRSCTDTGAFANFVSKTLDSTDIIVVVIALVIVQSVTTKLPDMKQDFSRHGIVSFLKQLSSADLKEYVVPEVYRKQQGSPSKEKSKLLSRDRDDFMQQLLSWQRNPKLFIDNLSKMKGGEKTEIREGQEEMDEEEGEEEMEMATSPEASHKKMNRATLGMEGMEEEVLDEGESNDKSESLLIGLDEQDAQMKEETLEKPHLKESVSMRDDLLENPSEGLPEMHLVHNTKSTTLSNIEKKFLESTDLLNDELLASSIQKNKAAPVRKEKATPSKPKEYTLKQAREDLKKLASETLDKVGADFGEKSEESVMLENIRKSLADKDNKGLVQLSEFFKSKRNMTYYEFSQADFIKPLLSIFLSDSNSTEDIARFLTIYYDSFYKGNNFEAIKSLYSNLLDFIGRLPEVTPFLSNDQLARSSFVQELRYLSTPLKIKVNFHQALARSLSKEDFIEELTHEFPHLDRNTKEGLYNDCVGTLKLFKEAFLKQSSVWLQVERFASLKSVEVYLIDKFTTKNLMAVNDDFARKRQKETDDKDLTKKGESIDSETILTNDYLQRKLEEQMNFGKEKDIRRYFEKQYIRKPSKLICINFELKIPQENGDFTRKSITSQTTLHELVSILTKEQPKKNLTSIELDYSIEIKTDLYHKNNQVKVETPSHKSSLAVLYNEIKTKMQAIEDELDSLEANIELQEVILALKLIIELDLLKSQYIDGPSSRIHQQIKLGPDYTDCLGDKLADQKLSSVYTKIFTKPSKILGQSFPLLSKLLCSQIPELFDFNTRYYFFKHLQFEPTRAMYFIYQANKPAFKEIPGSKIGKLKRKKLKVNRDQILEGAKLTFSISDFQTNVLEFDFEQEEGSGLGPTLEFYSLLAENFRKRGKEMWRDTEDFSFFPRPFNYDQKDQRKLSEEINSWKVLGAICGRSILDERIFDMRFSEAFWKVVLGRRVGLTDIRPVNEGLMKTLSDMQALANKYQLEVSKCKGESASEIDAIKSQLSYNGVKIEDLCLVFTLPGYEDYELMPNGSTKEVDLDNLELYVDLVIKTYLVDSIMPYVEAFREGISMFISIDKLECFLTVEMEMVVCGNKLETWTFEYLKENIVPLHGYSQGSKTFNNFLQVLSEFTEDQKREFLMFTIGAPRLPLGGLKHLSPQLTVVKKHPPNEGLPADDILPSVMTCQNYIKLPDYGSKEALRRKLLMAMREGQKSFTLS